MAYQVVYGLSHSVIFIDLEPPLTHISSSHQCLMLNISEAV